MANTTDFETEMEAQFGTLTAEQLWLLTKFGKNIRLRCRNNVAFNNFMNRTFPYAQFRQVQKTRTNYRTGLPESYPGLQITVNGKTAGADESDD